MISSFSPTPTRNKDIIPYQLPLSYGGNERYLYVPNWYDQTVSVIDTDNDTVISTITLTAGKSFISIFYRSVDDSIYVFGNSYFNRIDCDDTSGTFNTVIEEGSAGAVTVATQLTYLPWPLDILCCSTSTTRFIRFADKNNAIAGFKQYNVFNQHPQRYGASGMTQIVFGHAPQSNCRLAPRMGYFLNGRRKNIIATSAKSKLTNGPYTFLQEYWSDDLDGSGRGSQFVFGNLMISTTQGVIYGQLLGEGNSPLYGTWSGGTGWGSSNTPFFEFCPTPGNSKQGRIFWADNTTGGASAKLYVYDIGWRTYSSVGTLDRAAYKATNERGTDQLIYNFRNDKLYVRPSTWDAIPATVDKIHVYRPSAALGSMYLTSVTVGNLVSSQLSPTNVQNKMTFNRTKYYEAPNVFI